MAVDAGQPCGRDVSGQIDQKIVLRLPRQEQRALRREVAGLHGHDFSAARRTVFQDLRLDLLEAAVRVTQKNQSQDGPAVLI